VVSQERFKLLMVAGVNHPFSACLPTTSLGQRQQQKIRSASVPCSFLIVLLFSARRSHRAINVHQPLQLVPSPLFSWSLPCGCLAISSSSSSSPLYLMVAGRSPGSWLLLTNFPLWGADAGYARLGRTCSFGSYESIAPNSTAFLLQCTDSLGDWV
jgi:hypothetical protein